MSSFNCELCNATHLDTRLGYVSGCIHYEQRHCDACGELFDLVDGSREQLVCPSCWPMKSAEK